MVRSVKLYQLLFSWRLKEYVAVLKPSLVIGAVVAVC